MRKQLLATGLLAIGLLAVGACAANHSVAQSGAPQTAWRSLMDPTAWRGYKVDTIPSRWSFANGMLSKTRPVQDIISKDEFGDFELELEWKIGRAGNSGIFYRGTEQENHIYWTAPEYQLLDDIEADDNKPPSHLAASLYDMYAPAAGHLKPVGAWNATRIIVKGNHVEHWLNGAKVLEFEMWSPDWNAHLAKSKFKVWQNFAKATRGHLAIQGDHPGELAFRNIRIRELK